MPFTSDPFLFCGQNQKLLGTLDQMPQSTPLTIRSSAGCQALSASLAFITWTFTATWHEPAAPAAMLMLLTFVFLFCRAIYRGREWTRWLLLVVTIMSLFGFSRSLAHFEKPIEQARFIIQFVLGVIGVILQFLPPSNRWYRATRQSQVS